MMRTRCGLSLCLAATCAASPMAAAQVVYTFDTDVEGWTSGHPASVVGQDAGRLVQAYADPGGSPFDPFMNGPIENYNGDLFREFSMNVTVTDAPAGVLHGAVYWFTGSGHGRAQFTLANGTQEVSLNLSDDHDPGAQDHAGTIRNIRIDIPEGADGAFAQYASATVAIDEIRIDPIEGAPPAMELDNGVIKVAADLGSGGAITHLALSGDSRNLINNFDRGRQVQQSYYAGTPLDRRADGQHPAWSPWPWNPIQVGDAYGHSSTVLEAANDGAELYTKTVPLLWDMNNEPGECHFETWIRLEINTVHVRGKLTCFRTDTRWNVASRHQELPAVYTIADLHTLYTYDGAAPFTNDALTIIPPVTGGGFPWSYWTNPENWAAQVDEGLWGVGVYNPTTELFIGGFVGTPGGGAYDASTGYISPLRTLALDKGTVFEYEYDLVVGSLGHIRAFAYNEEGYPDSDGDGLSYDDETRDLDPDTPGVQNPFDPSQADTTGDNGAEGPDGVPDGQNDWDGDGLTNAEELDAGTSPIHYDEPVDVPLSFWPLLLVVLLVALAAGCRAAGLDERRASTLRQAGLDRAWGDVP